jgi:uncharacterized protein (TIGR02118 family)
MLVRCAYYVGTVRPEDKDRFDRYVQDVHLPMVAAWPRLRGLRLLRNDGRAYQGEAPRHYQSFELSFDDQEAMDACMASEDRRLTRERSAADFAGFKGLFRGEIHHVNYEVIDIPRPG